MNQTTHSESPSEETEAKIFIPVRLASLRLDTVTGFDLYVRPRPGDPPVLYREKALPFDESVRRRLEENEVRELFVSTSQEKEWRRYLERNLSAVLQDPALGIEEKSELAYSSTQELVRETFETPRSNEMIQRARQVVISMVGFMLREKGALASLMKVMSFDYYTYTHSVNVFVFSVALARRCGYDDNRALRDLGQGTLLHDVGKSMLDPALVNFEGKYTPAQFREMKKHPLQGHVILKRQGTLSALALDIVRRHHEKFGGNGYPDGLKEPQISPFVRICTIADIFDALTTERSYRNSMDSFAALKLMKEENAKDLDPKFFRTFVEMLGDAGSS